MIAAPQNAGVPAATAPMTRLPDELLIHILHHCPAESFAPLRLVNRNMSRLASDPSVQRAVFAPELIEPVSQLHKLRGHAQPLSPPARKKVMTRAASFFNRDKPAIDAPKSWLHLVQQVEHVQRATQKQMRIDKLRQAFVPSIWTGIHLAFLGGLGLGSLLCDQGAMHNSPELIGIGLGCTVLAFALLCFSPIFWLAYNLVGLAIEEYTALSQTRLDRLLAGPCRKVGLLLETLA